MKCSPMLNSRTFLAIGLFSLTAAAITRAAAPKVTKTVPENEADDVDPNLKEIRVTFDQDMTTGRSFSICGGGPNFPNIIGNPRWRGKRTIVLRVRLQADHEYQFSINCPGAKNFRSAKGVPAVIHPVSFRTAPAKGVPRPEKLTADQNKEAIQELRRALDEDYSYHDLRHVDWDALFAKYEPKMFKATSPRAFAKEAAKLLAAAKDMHIWLNVGDETIGTYRRKVTPNVNLISLAKAVPKWKKRNKCVTTGRFDDGLGYILITTWSRDCADDLEAVYEALYDFADAKWLIIDVRPNAGGAEPLAQKFAGCFTDTLAVYAKHVYRGPDQPDGFTKPHERVLKPTKGRPKFRGPVAVLMGPENMSSCEAFLLMMKQVPRCTLIGGKSYGSSGNPKSHDLGNGVAVFLPSWKALRPDGSCFEGQGIKPHVTVKTTKKQRFTQDPVLETALKRLRKP